MHPRTKAKTKEITKTVLDLAANGLLTWMALGSTQNIRKQGRAMELFGDYAVTRIREAVKRLKMQAMIKYDENDVKSPIALTEKGMMRLTRLKFRDVFKKRKKWDYFWRIIFFDIPEQQKHIRDLFRRELIAAGFYPFQQSVYVCPFDCAEAIEDLCRMFMINGYVLFCVTPSLGRKEKEVKNFFFARGRITKSR